MDHRGPDRDREGHRATPRGSDAAVDGALAALNRHLDRCALAANTTKAYRARTRAYAAWLDQHAGEHQDAFVDQVGAEAAVTAWRRHLITTKAGPSTVNQALAAVDLLYEIGAGLQLKVKRARVPRPGEPDALTPKEQGAVERAADRRGARDAAIVALLLYTGARAQECARLDLDDLALSPAPARSAYTARATKAARFRSPPRHANGSAPGCPIAAARRDRCGPANAASSPPPASPRWCSPSVPPRPARAAPAPPAPHLRDPVASGRRRLRAGSGAARARLARHHRPVLPRWRCGAIRRGGEDFRVRAPQIL